MQPDPRDAIVARREQVAAEPRPTRLSHVDVAEHVDGVKETDDLYRLYRPEWVIVYAAETPHPWDSDEAKPLFDEVKKHYEEKYAGRVREGDILFRVPDELYARVELKLRLPTLKGEFKRRHLALQYAKDQQWADARVVLRNSKADHELRAYGVKKLPT